MESIHDEIKAAFGQGEKPHETEIVLWDGFDQLEKEGAVRFYSGKTWRDVLAHLRGLEDQPVFGGAYFLEEWAVLSPSALSYHARAHFEFLYETLASSRPDEEFVFHLLGQLYQVAYMYKGSPVRSSSDSSSKADRSVDRREGSGLRIIRVLQR